MGRSSDAKGLGDSRRDWELSERFQNIIILNICRGAAEPNICPHKMAEPEKPWVVILGLSDSKIQAPARVLSLLSDDLLAARVFWGNF